MDNWINFAPRTKTFLRNMLHQRKHLFDINESAMRQCKDTEERNEHCHTSKHPLTDYQIFGDIDGIGVSDDS